MPWDALNQCDLFEATGVMLTFMGCIWPVTWYFCKERVMTTDFRPFLILLFKLCIPEKCVYFVLVLTQLCIVCAVQIYHYDYSINTKCFMHAEHTMLNYCVHCKVTSSVLLRSSASLGFFYTLIKKQSYLNQNMFLNIKTTMYKIHLPFSEA